MVAEESYRYIPLGQARKVIEGTDITVVAYVLHDYRSVARRKVFKS